MIGLIKKIFCSFFLLCCLSGVGYAIPTGMNYQGKLVNSSGIPVSGNQTIVFSLYNAASGGTSIWSSSQTVAVTNGYFNVNLTVTSDKFGNSDVYLGVKVGSDSEMTPRVKLSVSPFAYKAGALIDDDVTIYRHTTNTLKTNNNMIVSGNLEIAGNTTVTGNLTVLGTIMGIFSGTNAIYSGTVTADILNATSTLKLNGTNINTTGTLTNVAYKGQDNTFSIGQSITGTVTANNFYTTGGVTGNRLSDGTISITGGNLTGATGLTATNLTGTLQTATQPNITSLGTLTALNSSGTVTANKLTDGTASLTGGALSGVTTLGVTNINASGGVTANRLSDGTASITGGAMSGVTTLTMNNQLTNTLADGTAPMIITSTTKVSSLNVDRVDDYHFNQSLLTTDSPTFANLTINGTATADIVNATSTLKLNGTNINTTGTLTNVAYKGQDNSFTIGQTITGTVTANHFYTAGGVTANRLSDGTASITGGAITGATNTNWDTAYTDRLKWDGGATGLTAETGRTSLGLGDMSLQSSNNMTISGGTITGTSINNSAIGATTASTGRFTTLNVSGNIILDGTVSADIVNATSTLKLNGTNINTTGTLTNVAYKGQDNAFSTGQSITGTVTANNFYTTGGVTGNRLSDGTISITGGNLTGATGLTATNLTGTLQTATQPNITSLGTLTALNSSGTVTANKLYSATTLGVRVATPIAILEVTGNGTVGTPIFSAYPNADTTAGLTVSSNGSVRIGLDTLGTTAKLEIQDDNPIVSIRNKAGSQTATLVLKAFAGPTMGGMSANASSGEVSIGGWGTTYFPTFYSGNTEYMRITSTGNVGIGTTTPVHKFEVNGEARISNGTHGVIYGPNMTNGIFFLRSGVTGTYADLVQIQGFSPYTATFLGGITANGTVTANKLTDGTASLTGGALSGVTTLGVTNINASGGVTANRLSDGTISITGGNLTGATGLTATNLTGTLQTATQPNITSVGTLTALNSSGTVTANKLTDGTISITSGAISGLSTLGVGVANPTARLEVTGNGTAGTPIFMAYPTANSSAGLMVSSNGYVGIGITSPLYRLDIEGADTQPKIRIKNNYSGTGMGLILDNESGNSVGGSRISFQNVGIENAYIIYQLGSGTAPSLQFGTNSAECMRIISDGSVGIGTTTPNAKLSVLGDVIVTGNISTNGTVTANKLTDGTASLTGGALSGLTTLSVSNINVSGTATADIVNATSTLKLNGTNINTTGTLTNVAYKGQDNSFTIGQTITGTVTANHFYTAGGVTANRLSDGTASITGGAITGATNTNWDTAYTDRLKWDGGATGLTAETGRTSLGLVIGTNVQAYHANLAAIAAGTWTGASSITTLGTISTGVWNGTAIGVTKGGTGLTTLTAGYIPYGNGESAFGNSANLFWNSANSRLGIGTANPTTMLEIQDDNPTVSIRNKAATQWATLALKTSGGSIMGAMSAYSSSGEVRIGGWGTTFFPTFYSGNTEYMRITTTGNVGIGTTTPNTKLTVIGTTRFINGTSHSVIYGPNKTDGKFFFRSAELGNEATDQYADLFILEGYSPYTATFLGSVNISSGNYVGRYSGNDLAFLHWGEALNSTGALRMNIDSDGNDTSQYFSIVTNATGFNSGTTLMVVNESGNVGIGTTTPNASLTIMNAGGDWGYEQLRLIATANSARQYFQAGDGSVFTIGKHPSSVADGAVFLFNEAATAMAFGISGVEKMRIHSNGYVGIGTAAPNSFLQIGTGSSYATYPGKIFIGDSVVSGPNAIGGIEFQSQTANSGYGAKIYTDNEHDLLGIATRYNSATWTERVIIKLQTGYVGIGTDTPASSLDVNGNISMQGATALFRDSSRTILIEPVAGREIVLKVNATHVLTATEAGVSVAGNLSASGTKPFDIPHPDPEKKAKGIHLRHYAVETPSVGGTLYSLEITANIGENTMMMDDYFEFLNEKVTCYVSPIEHFGRGWAKYEGKNKIKLVVDTAGKYNVLVLGNRKDEGGKKGFENYGIEYLEEKDVSGNTVIKRLK